MSLRSKILILFVTLAIGPLMVVGITDYVQSVRLVTRLVETNLSLAGERAAGAVGARYAGLQAELAELARAYEAAGPPPAAGRAADPAGTFDGLEIRSASGDLVRTIVGGAPSEAGACSSAEHVRFEAPLGVPGAGEPARLVGYVSMDRLLAGGALVPPFGASGRTVVVDRRTGRPLYDPGCELRDGGLRDAGFRAQPAGEPVASPSLVQYPDRESVRTASVVHLDEPSWTVVTSTDLDEFTAGEKRIRMAWLALVLFLALATAGVGVILITYVMRSLDQVSDAAERIGGGDLTPWLPPPGHDEVGKLSLAIGRMVLRVKTAMRQLERSRQMAVVGELATHLSHEVRNPLSSIRLNLQSVEREARTGTVPADLGAVLQLCLREITRLDRVVGNVLRLGRARPGALRPTNVNEVVEESLAVVASQLATRGIRIESRTQSTADTVLADRELLSGALLNLYLNAADAMPDGGALRVWTEAVSAPGAAPVVRIHVADEGAGISPELREQIFEPFFTTKTHGSGIGLPLALQTAEAHGGRLYLETRSELESGSEFVLELPLADAGGRAAAESHKWRERWSSRATRPATARDRRPAGSATEAGP